MSGRDVQTHTAAQASPAQAGIPLSMGDWMPTFVGITLESTSLH